jgi:hypothetical protein
MCASPRTMAEPKAMLNPAKAHVDALRQKDEKKSKPAANTPMAGGTVLTPMSGGGTFLSSGL